MKFCPKCRKEMPDEANFCIFCGEKIPEKRSCPCCGAPAVPEALYCMICGADLMAASPSQSRDVPAEPDTREALPGIPAEEIPDPSELSEKLPEELSEETPEELSEELSEETPEELSEETPEELSEETSEELSEETSEENPEESAAAAADQPERSEKPLLDSTRYLRDREPVSGSRILKIIGLSLGCIAGIVALVVVVGMLMNLNRNSAGNCGLYLKDGQIQSVDFFRAGPLRVTEELMDEKQRMALNSPDAPAELTRVIRTNDKGNILFYPDGISSGDHGIDLYCRSLEDPEKAPTKIDTDVRRYAINAAGTQAVYMKGPSQALYLWVLGEKTRLSESVDCFQTSKDQTRIGYLAKDGSYWIWHADGSCAKLAGDLDSLVWVSEDVNRVYYLKDGDLYTAVDGDSKQLKIAGNVERVLQVYGDGTLYFIRPNLEETRLMLYVKDSLALSDEAMTEPVKPTYPEAPAEPTQEDHPKEEDLAAALEEYAVQKQTYDEACAQMDSKYEQENQAYLEKQERDKLRKSLKDKIQLESSSLWYYDGKTETMLTDRMAEECVWSQDAPAVLYRCYDPERLQPIEISEIAGAEDVEKALLDAQVANTLCYGACGARITEIDEDFDPWKFYAAPDGSALYFLDQPNDLGLAELCRMEAAGEAPGNPVLTDAGISDLFFDPQGRLCYYKNLNTGTSRGDLYVAGSLVDYEVCPQSVLFREDGIWYLTDWSENRETGTLRHFLEGESAMVAEGVHVFALTGPGEVLYLTDYDPDRDSGSLCLAGETEPLAEDVTTLIPVS